MEIGWRDEPSGTDGRDEAEAAPLHRFDEPRRLGIVLERDAQLADGLAEHPFGDRHVRPDGLEQVVLADQRPRSLGQVIQHTPGFRPQWNRPAILQELAAAEVQLEAAELNAGRRRRLNPPCRRPASRRRRLVFLLFVGHRVYLRLSGVDATEVAHRQPGCNHQRYPGADDTPPSPRLSCGRHRGSP